MSHCARAICLRGYFLTFTNISRSTIHQILSSRIPVSCRFISFDASRTIMDKSKLITARFQEIDETAKTLKEKLLEYEREFYEKFLVAVIEEKNRVLQSQVHQAVEELNTLERCNGQSEVVSNIPSNKEKDVKSSIAPSQATPAPSEDNKKSKPDQSKEKKETKTKENKKPAPAQEEGPVDVGRLDMRVGKIVEIKKHPDADALYVEQVDIGKPNPITVVSGLVKHVPIEEMQNRLVVILCNLKPAKMRGVLSEGMVMCASTPEKVEVLRPPPSSVPGDVISVEGYTRCPDAVMNPKKKIFETVAPDLKTDDGLCATYKGAKWFVEGKGHVTSDSLKGVNVK
uniref:tRNA-binding domain-containing protein n=1 Tax=Lygus hesperus TaxID=30085 RepID=A0A0K8S5A3_LYGHE